MALPTDPKARKAIPVYSGFIAYFPDAIAAVAQLSQKANDQHNPGEPLHWAKEKSTDEPDAGARHMLEPLMIGGTPYDTDGAAHLIKKAWRAMAELQRWLDAGNIPFAPLTPFGEALHASGGSGASGSCYYCSEPVREDAPKSCPCPNNHLPSTRSLHIPVEAVKSGEARDYMLGSAARAASHVMQRRAGAHFCSQCGADLEEGGHAAGCLRYNRQHE